MKAPLSRASFLCKPPIVRMSQPQHTSKAYNRASLGIVLGLLVVWFVASFLCSILARDWLDEAFPAIGNAPFGFWMSQQGSIIVFILILIAYRFLMNRLDQRHGLVEDAQDPVVEDRLDRVVDAGSGTPGEESDDTLTPDSSK